MKVTQEECDKLKSLLDRARNTPLIAMTVKDGLEGKDFSSLAWKQAEEYYDEIAKKYNFDPRKQCINSKTLEIVDLPSLT